MALGKPWGPLAALAAGGKPPHQGKKSRRPQKSKALGRKPGAEPRAFNKGLQEALFEGKTGLRVQVALSKGLSPQNITTKWKPGPARNARALAARRRWPTATLGAATRTDASARRSYRRTDLYKLHKIQDSGELGPAGKTQEDHGELPHGSARKFSPKARGRGGRDARKALSTG
jgi:hypothetical protein